MTADTDELGTTKMFEPIGLYDDKPLTLGQWTARDVPKPDYLLGHIFTTTTRAMLSADTGLGKTHLGFAMGFAMAAGKNFCHWQGRRPARVLIIDGEMSAELVKARLADAERRIGERPVTLFVLCREDFPDMQPLDTPAGQAWLDDLIDYYKIDFVILDNVMALTAGDLKDEESWKPVIEWMKSLTKRRVGCLWIHHTGYDKSRAYGTSTRAWQLDTVIVGEKIDNAADADLAMKITFTKARQRTPDTRDDFEPVDIRLIADQWQSTAASRQRKPPKNSNVAVAALREAVEAVGEKVPGMAGVPSGTSGVKLNTWRGYFYKHVPVDAEDNQNAEEVKRAKDTRKTQFRRCRDALQEAGAIGCVADWYWFLE